MSRAQGNINSYLLKRARAALKRRVPPKSEQKRIAAKARKQWHVFGTYLGLKRKGGRWTKQIALICLTEHKLAIRTIAKSRRIPQCVAWTERKRRFRIDTDVIAAAPELQLQATTLLGPGDRVEFDGDGATIGAAVDHPEFGRCITTAGHLFSGPGDEGEIAVATSNGVSVRTRVQRCVRARSTDYALLHPVEAADCDNLFQDLIRIGPSYIPKPSDAGRELFVLDNLDDSVKTICRGVNATLELPSGVYENVVLCDAVTVGGQSGAALVDSDNRLWGFLIGVFDRFSVFMPAERLLRQEQSHLA